MTVKFEKLKKTIIKCNKCPRLVRFRKKISTEKRKQYMNQTYWGKPVTGFGDINGKIMICLLYTSPSPRDSCASRMPSSA